jgi:hypothetical protein
MRTATLQRDSVGDDGTFGTLTLDNGWKCSTVELPWRNNQRGISCIPAGTYTVQWLESLMHGMCYHIQGVPGRSEVEIHAANWGGDVSKGYKSDLRGCIGLGLGRAVLSGQKAVIWSQTAIQEFHEQMSHAPFTITILDLAATS